MTDQEFPLRPLSSGIRRPGAGGPANEELDDRFHESCHKGGFICDFKLPTWVLGFETKD